MIRPPILSVTCDGCGDVHLQEATETSDAPIAWDARDAISSARAEGWQVNDDGEAYCPRCVESERDHGNNGNK